MNPKGTIYFAECSDCDFTMSDEREAHVTRFADRHALQQTHAVTQGFRVPQTLTLQHAKCIGRVQGFSINKRDGEYRVNLVGGREATAYYTNDLQDAIDTGRDMTRREQSAREAVRSELHAAIIGQ